MGGVEFKPLSKGVGYYYKKRANFFFATKPVTSSVAPFRKRKKKGDIRFTVLFLSCTAAKKHLNDYDNLKGERRFPRKTNQNFNFSINFFFDLATTKHIFFLLTYQSVNPRVSFFLSLS